MGGYHKKLPKGLDKKQRRVYNEKNKKEGVVLKRFSQIDYLQNIFPCLFYGIVCGSFTGAVIFAFKLCAKKAEGWSHTLYESAKQSPLYVASAFAVLFSLALVMYFLHKKIPEVKGGGIPRSEGVLRGVLGFRWFKTLIGTFFGSMISFFAGLPLGSEGPAVLMGTAVGNMCGCISTNKSTWNRYIMSGGAGAGFAVATGAPLSGILFVLEEIHKRFTPMLVLSVSASVVSATFVNRVLCSFFDIQHMLFEMETLEKFRLTDAGYLVLLGVIVALAVGLFDASIRVFDRLTSRFRVVLTDAVKLCVIFGLTGILAFCFDEAVYSGHHVILEAAFHSSTITVLMALFVIRLLMMLFVTNSGPTGGIFIPTLAIGSLISAVASRLLVFAGMDERLCPAVVLLGMCAFIGGTLRAPLTASVLFLELTGQFENLLFVAIVVFLVSFITELFNQSPFYDIALEKMEHAQNGGRQAQIDCFEMTVGKNAFVAGKAVRDIMWPHSTVVVSIIRADESKKDMDNDGEKKLYVGDTIVVRSKYFDEAELKRLLSGLVDTKDIKKTEIM